MGQFNTPKLFPIFASVKEKILGLKKKVLRTTELLIDVDRNSWATI